jgi:hypothetical protein
MDSRPSAVAADPGRAWSLLTLSRPASPLAVVVVVVAAVLTVCARVAPRLWDLSPEAITLWHLMPVGALGLFAGARLRGAWAYLVPALAMLVSDLLLIKPLAAVGQASFSWMTPIIYASFTLNVLLGRLLARTSWPVTAFGGALAGSVQFFLVTNFAVWAGGDGVTYPRTFMGLLECYVAAAPFYRNTLAGDLLFSGLFFGVYHALAAARERREASQPA